MCQPGRPRPKGASQLAPTSSSPASERFHSAKSVADSFSYLSVATRAPVRRPDRSSRDSRPYAGKLEIRKYTPPSAS